MTKSVLFTITILLALPMMVVAQQRLDSTDFDKNRGKMITLCDTVHSFKIMSDTLTLVDLGAVYHNQKCILAIKGRKIQLDWAHFQHKHICVTGALEYYKGNRQIVILEPNQIRFQ